MTLNYILNLLHTKVWYILNVDQIQLHNLLMDRFRLITTSENQIKVPELVHKLIFPKQICPHTVSMDHIF